MSWILLIAVDGQTDRQNNERHLVVSSLGLLQIKYPRELYPFYKPLLLLDKSTITMASQSDESKKLTIVHFAFPLTTWAFELETRSHGEVKHREVASIWISPTVLFPSYSELIHRYSIHIYLPSYIFLGELSLQILCSDVNFRCFHIKSSRSPYTLKVQGPHHVWASVRQSSVFFSYQYLWGIEVFPFDKVQFTKFTLPGYVLGYFIYDFFAWSKFTEVFSVLSTNWNLTVIPQ